MREPTPSDLVIELLRTLDEAQSDWDPRAGGGGVIRMPSLYNEGSYQELETCLQHMRDDALWRRPWWHASMRYRWGNEQRIVVRSRKTSKGRVPILPARSELRITGESLGSGLMVVQVYTWSDAVDNGQVHVGVTRLLATMHNGDTTRLRLPVPLLYRMLGTEPRDAAEGRTYVQPVTRHVPGHAQPAP